MNRLDATVIQLPLYFMKYLLLLAALLSGPGLSREPSPVVVYVSILPLKHFVERVGGDLVRVEVMVGPGQSPATYEPLPRQMAGLETARVFFRTGVPFEDVWIQRIAAANPKLEIVDLREGLDLQPVSGHGQQPGSVPGRSTLDPHIWTSPVLVRQMSERIRDVLTRLDPPSSSGYAEHQIRFAAALQGLDAEIRALFSGKSRKTILVYHPSWGYFARTYGLVQMAIEADGKEPGPKGLGAIIDAARKQGLRDVFFQQQFRRQDAEAVARALGGKAIAVDPLAEDYIPNLRSVAKAFARSLE